MTEQMQIKYAPALEQKPITFNFEEIKTDLVKNLDKYQNLVVTEDSIKEARDTKAKLNKFRESIETERKRVKNQCMEPYNAFEKQIKELVALIDEPVKAIDTQIKSFEEKELDEKKTEIGKLFKANIGPLESIVSIKDIYVSQWENKTYTLKKIEKEMIEAIEKINSDLRVISGFRSDFETELRTTYLDTFNLETVLNKKQKLEEQARFIEEQKQIAEQKELEKAADTLAQTMAEEKAVIETTLHVVEPVQEVQEKYYTQNFSVHATKSQLVALSEFMNKNDIEFAVIPKELLATAS